MHDPRISKKKKASGIFLSGNGPLVKIMRAALIDKRVSAESSKRHLQHEVSTFIQNIHQFLRYHHDHLDVLPHENVVVFDEAQRAWNSGQMNRKQKMIALRQLFCSM